MKRNIDEIREIMKGYFQKHPEIEVAYVFGSVTQGRVNVLSDIDIAIILDKGQVNEKLYRYGYKAEILTDLIKLLRTNNVDLVILNEANFLLKHRVLYFSKVDGLVKSQLLTFFKNSNKKLYFVVVIIRELW